MIMSHPGNPGDPDTDQETRHFNRVKFKIHMKGFEDFLSQIKVPRTVFFQKRSTGLLLTIKYALVCL